MAERGVHLVLAARSAQALDDVASECRQCGVSATTVVVDLATPGAPDVVMQRALDRHGRVDTWVNLASTLVAGEFGVETDAEIEQIVQTNLVGPLRACRVALRQFRQQERGVLIDVASMLGVVPNPVVPLYTMTKYGRRGLALALHYLAPRWGDVHVCTVLPGPIDTPLFQRSANHTGHVLRAIPPAIATQRAAAAIVSCARRPRRQVPIGATSRLILLGLRVAPALTERLVALWSGTFITRGESAPDSFGAVFHPEEPMQVDGGWRRGATRRKLGDAIGHGIARHV
jgi:short-subunit dehydrogenase